MNEIRNVLNNAAMAYNNMNINTDTKAIVSSFFKLLNEYMDGLLKVNEIDVRNNNGFGFDIYTLKSLQKEMLKVDDSYRKILYMQKDEKNNYISGLQTDNIGTICLIYDGNTYNLIEVALKCILTHNALIAVNENDYMSGTNELIVILIKRILNAFQVDTNLIQIIHNIQPEDILDNSASINRTIVIGNNDLQQKVKKISEIETIYKGFGEYDIYIEDITNIEFIKEILQQDINLNIFVNDSVVAHFDDCFYVGDIDEAIGQINTTTCGNSSTIFTDDGENAVKFLREIKTENVSVNSNPIIQKYVELDISLLLTNKNMYYPNPVNSFKDGNKFVIPTDDAILDKRKNYIAQEQIEELRNENDSLKADNQEMQSNSLMQLEEKDKEIAELKRQLSESRDLANKYVGALQKSTFSRLFAKIKKEDIEKDMKLLS